MSLRTALVLAALGPATLQAQSSNQVLGGAAHGAGVGLLVTTAAYTVGSELLGSYEMRAHDLARKMVLGAFLGTAAGVAFTLSEDASSSRIAEPAWMGGAIGFFAGMGVSNAGHIFGAGTDRPLAWSMIGLGVGLVAGTLVGLADDRVTAPVAFRIGF